MTGYPAVQFFEKATVGGLVKGTFSRHWLGIQMDVNQAVATVPWQKKMEPNFSAWFHQGIQQDVGASTRVKLLAPKFLDFKFILSVCSGCKGRDQHRERIGVAYLPSN